MKLGKPIIYGVCSDNFLMNFTPYILIGLYGEAFQKIRMPVRFIIQDQLHLPILSETIRR